MKFTFKTIKGTGRYASFYPDNHQIKLRKQVIGSIGDSYPHEIRLMVVKDDIMEDGNPNCTWKWITLKHISEDLKAAKDYCNSILSESLPKVGKWNLYLRDETK